MGDEVKSSRIGRMARLGWLSRRAIPLAWKRLRQTADADSDEARAGRDRMIKLAADEGPAAIAREMVPKLVGETTKKLQPDLLEAVRRLIMMNSAEGISTALGALRDRPDSTPLLAAIDFPTLIIAGNEDAIIPVTEAQAMHRAIPGSSLVVLPRAGHLSNLEDPFGWRTALDHWLGGVWSFK